ncbi:hypothetical protein BEP19_11450 [Ammoniphilus oxalaticus]|uniref:Uncharacterized protein n=1 Tax=Ammoniphilus oxalaticus TaxID=66863 RepID=A0A419SGE6_9BACL|nr:hypothetical protein [Ammoniphilus oxalaticus]RKD22850.1 hypothetical protein BEP19_11450 [Ammoniphilus oxalaticus]
MYIVEMKDEGMKGLSSFILDELKLEAIFARAKHEEMIGLYTTEQLISPSIQYVLSNVSKGYNEARYEVQFINMTHNEHKSCYFDDLQEVKDLILMIREMVEKEEAVKEKIARLIDL